MKTPKPSVPDLLPSDPLQTSIDTVLTGLREAQPSPGLERRLLETLASHPASSVHLSRRWPRLSSATHDHLHPRAAIALAASLVVTLSFAFLYQHHQPFHTTFVAAPSAAIPVRSSIAAAPSGEFTRDVCCHSDPARNRREGTPASALSHGAQRRTSATHPKLLQLASYPAPPMPLTDQEKLLLRVAHSASPQQSTIINPNLQARAEAASAAEFQLFFVAATTIRKQEPPPD